MVDLIDKEKLVAALCDLGEMKNGRWPAHNLKTLEQAVSITRAQPRIESQPGEAWLDKVQFFAGLIEKETWTEYSGNELHAHQVALGYCRSNAKQIMQLIEAIRRHSGEGA